MAARQFHDVGRTDSLCPYCLESLEKRPQRKVKCPACGQAIHVRTRPLDELKVLLRSSDLAILEKDWELDYKIKANQPRAIDPVWVARLAKAYATEADPDPEVESAARAAFVESTQLMREGIAPRDARDKALSKYEGEFWKKVDIRLWQLQVRSIGG
jgi:hypothetical protein